MLRLSVRSRWGLIALVFLLGLLASLWLAGRFAQQRGLAERAAEADAQLELYAQNIHTLVERFRSVPALLALDSDIRDLLIHSDDARRQQALSQRLERLNRAGGSAVLYLLDRQGSTLSASNWNEPTSFVGSNYSFRPYFQDAMNSGSGRYFAVGVTTGVPGYFLSHVVLDDRGQPLGVLVVKLELEELQRDWLRQSGVLLVADSHGIVILANRPAWRFRYLQSLDERLKQHLVDARKYASQNLLPLESLPLQHLGPYSTLTRVASPDGTQDYLWQRLPLEEEGWTLHLLVSPDLAAADLRSYRLAAVGLWMTLAFFLLFLFQRSRTLRLQKRHREELEALVQARTEQLRLAQDELVQAAKMAALGQMSAALAHEINQPLTAMQMQLASVRLLIDAARPEQARESLQRIESLLQRLAALTGHLKTFARKSPGGLRERIDLAQVVEQAMQLLMPRIRRDGVSVVRDYARAPAEVLGDGIRLEQVVLNLLHNALDALKGVPRPRLTLRLQEADGCWQLSVEDNGAGIAEAHLRTVFDPFFTTKPVGEGLGLGLAVSYGIVRELGGSLEVANVDPGAVFTLRLARVEALMEENA